MVPQHTGDKRAVRCVERGVQQRHGPLPTQRRQVTADDRARGADHDRTGQVDVVRSRADVLRDLHGAQGVCGSQMHPNGFRGDLLMGADTSQTLAHSGCILREHDQFARTDQTLVWAARIVHVHWAEGLRRVIDQLREALDLLRCVHNGHHPAR
ncbi:hypothetical protein BBK82_16525 [Lentzea guizhouensis]|uniref:Uncharacterized protein n=1 Tax=Lentzea guizhouensis TaxID=1586287 RepID=A0A1B2HI74_9PSEU|nr:hypothetical protein BBK82_16525 [Lentzea guizhouensis]